MKLIKTASGSKIKISKKEWQNIGLNQGWIRIAEKGKEYMIDHGALFDENGDEVFGMKKLIKYFDLFKRLGIDKIPKFQNHEDANAFLAMIEKESGEKFGRVPTESVLQKLKDQSTVVRDPKKQRQEALQEFYDKRNKGFHKGRLF